MMAMVALLASLLGAASASAAGAASAAAADYDVVVYGSSPAGIAAATAAGVLGLKVALYEPLPMIGGMGAAGNLALNDGGNGAEHTGLALNFTRANAEWYCKEGITSVCSNTSQVSHPESFVSEASFRRMLGTAGIGAERIKTDCRVLSATTGGTPSKITSAPGRVRRFRRATSASAAVALITSTAASTKRIKNFASRRSSRRRSQRLWRTASSTVCRESSTRSSG